MAALETSIATDGWIGAITVAADGETFDGSARVEKTAENGMLDEAIVVDSDGSRPIVVRRTDIPTATDPRAVRLGIASNRVASLNLEWESDVLAGIADAGIDLGSLFTAVEWADVTMPALPEAGAGGDEFDATPEEGETRTKLGELWSIGKVHRLLVGDCTDPANVARLMGGERAALSEIDPPYEMDAVTQAGVCERGMGCIALWGMSFELFPVCEAWGRTPDLDLVWRFHFGRMYSKSRPFCHHRNIWLFGIEYYNVDWRAENNAPPSTFFEAAYMSEHHPHEKPIGLLNMLLEVYSLSGSVIFSPFLGSGTTLIAAHRNGRRCYGMEIAPRYADVCLRRAEAEGLECARVDE